MSSSQLRPVNPGAADILGCQRRPRASVEQKRGAHPKASAPEPEWRPQTVTRGPMPTYAWVSVAATTFAPPPAWSWTSGGSRVSPVSPVESSVPDEPTVEVVSPSELEPSTLASPDEVPSPPEVDSSPLPVEPPGFEHRSCEDPSRNAQRTEGGRAFRGETSPHRPVQAVPLSPHAGRCFD